jgi:hypothetical protein
MNARRAMTTKMKGYLANVLASALRKGRVFQERKSVGKTLAKADSCGGRFN